MVASKDQASVLTKILMAGKKRGEEKLRYPIQKPTGFAIVDNEVVQLKWIELVDDEDFRGPPIM